MFLFINYFSDMLQSQFLAIFMDLMVFFLMCATYMSTYLVAVYM